MLCYKTSKNDGYFPAYQPCFEGKVTKCKVFSEEKCLVLSTMKEKALFHVQNVSCLVF